MKEAKTNVGTNVETNVETNVIDIFAVDKKSSPAKAASPMAHFYSLSPDELSKCQALLYSLTADQRVLTPELKFICELICLEENAGLKINSVDQITSLMEFVFAARWLKHKSILKRKKNNNKEVTNSLILQYVDERLVRLKDPLFILTTGETERKDETASKQKCNRKAFIFNSVLRDDFSKWITDINAEESLSSMGGSISSSSSWLSSLPTKIIDCIRGHYGYNVVKTKRAKANGLLGINIINLITGIEDPTYLFFSGGAFTP